MVGYKLDTQTIPAGTVVHISGLPFRLVSDAPVEGHPLNFESAKDSLNFRIFPQYLPLYESEP